MSNAIAESKAAHALLVQLVERRSPKPDVGGSSPPGRAVTENKSTQNKCDRRYNSDANI